MKKIIFGLATITVIVIAIAGTISFYNFGSSNEAQLQNTIPRAAIIDQLHYDVPNPVFHSKATKILEAAGYAVEIITTEEITIDFYKKLPSRNYDFVIVRTHGAADRNDKNMVTLFTGEKYQEDKYISEQLFGQAKRVTPLYEIAFDTTEKQEWIIVNDTYRYTSSPARIATNSTNEYFAVTPILFDSAMEGRFSGTTFILAGCNTMDSDSLAKSLVKKGASEVVGWQGQLLATENDMMILRLLEELFESNIELPEAVNSLMDDYSDSWFNYNTRMKYYA